MQPLNGKSAELKAADGTDGQPSRPDPQVVERPSRRRFTARYKLRVLQETDGLPPGELGAYLRREGLYSSHLASWRKHRRAGALAGLEPRGREPKATTAEQALAKRVAQLEREKADLEERLRQATLILDVQKKVLSLCESAIEAERKSTA